MGVWAEIKRDAQRCGPWPRAWMRDMLLTTGSPALLGYRLRRRLHTATSRLLPRPLKIAMAVTIQLLIERRTHIDLPASASIGEGLYIPHVGYIIVSSQSTLGVNCTLCQGTTIGHAAGNGKQGSPVIGDRVYIGPSAIVIGPITIGNDCLIAPGAVVTRSAPPRTVLAGNPARQLAGPGAFELITYPGCECDVDRLESLQAMEQSAVTDNEPVEEPQAYANPN